jgi:hypothetical protein
MTELPEAVHDVISKHERWTFNSIASSPHDDEFIADLVTVLSLPRKIWIVQESLFGDYGNGEIVGVFTSEEEARECDAKYPSVADVTEVTLT